MLQPSLTTRTSDRGDADTRGADARRILAAARAVLKRSRYHSLKVRQVLVASNTSASIFYRLFPSKSHLLLALLEDETRLVDRRMREHIDAVDTAAEKIHAWLAFSIGNVFDRDRADRVRMFLDQGLLEELPKQVRLLHQICGGRLVDIIRQGMRDGEFRVGDPDADAMMVQHLVRGILADGLMGAVDCAEDSLVARAHDFVLRALGNT